MRKKYDFSQGKRGAVMKSSRKTSIALMLDNKIIETFRKRAEAKGTGYQDAINEALLAAISEDDAPLTANTLRRILRQELH